jgi:hypothetical protein
MWDVTPVVWCDNVSALALASNPVFHARTKHIEVDYHFIREKVLNQDILFSFISTADQLADVFTKGLSTARFHFLKSKLKVLPSPVNLRGDVKPSVQAATSSSDTKVDTTSTPYTTAGMTTSPNITAGANHSSLAHAANHSKPAQINFVKGNPTRQIFLARKLLCKPGNQYLPCPPCLNHSTTVQFYPRYSSSIHGIKDKSIRQVLPYAATKHWTCSSRLDNEKQQPCRAHQALIFSSRSRDCRSSKERQEKPDFLR